MMSRLLWLVSALLVWAGTGAASSPQRFSAVSNLVRVDVLVSRDNKPLVGLGLDDFEVRDGGVAQKIAYATSNRSAIDLILVVDESRSVPEREHAMTRSAFEGTLGGLTQGDRVAVIAAGETVVSPDSLATVSPDVFSTLGRPRDRPGTALVDAVAAALVLSTQATNSPAVVVFSDGVDTSSFLSASAVARVARRTDAVVFVVATSHDPGWFLRDVSHNSGGRVLRLQSAATLETTLRSVIADFRQRYILGFEPAAASTPGWRELEVRVKGQRATVTARRGYFSR